MYGHGNNDDPECTKSCTGFIIIFADCPVLWINDNLQIANRNSPFYNVSRENLLLLIVVEICFILLILFNI